MYTAWNLEKDLNTVVEGLSEGQHFKVQPMSPSEVAERGLPVICLQAVKPGEDECGW